MAETGMGDRGVKRCAFREVVPVVPRVLAGLLPLPSVSALPRLCKALVVCAHVLFFLHRFAGVFS